MRQNQQTRFGPPPRPCHSSLRRRAPSPRLGPGPGSGQRRVFCRCLGDEMPVTRTHTHTHLRCRVTAAHGFVGGVSGVNGAGLVASSFQELADFNGQRTLVAKDAAKPKTKTKICYRQVRYISGGEQAASEGLGTCSTKSRTWHGLVIRKIWMAFFILMNACEWPRGCDVSTCVRECPVTERCTRRPTQLLLFTRKFEGLARSMGCFKIDFLVFSFPEALRIILHW